MRRRSAVKTLALAAGSTLAGRNLAQASTSGREENLAVTAESAAILGGAHVLRTHDVAACRQVADLLDAVREQGVAS